MTEIRSFITDTETIKTSIHKKVDASVRAKFPIVGKKYTANLVKLTIEDKNYGYAKQNKAVLSKGSLSEGVIADITITDNETGEKIGELNKHRLLNIPYFTSKHTFMVEGNEYSVINQLRLKPGVYTRKRGNDELESSFNLGKGANFRLVMDPQTGIFTLSILNRSLSFGACLKILGADMNKAKLVLGADLYRDNMAFTNTAYMKALDHLYGSLAKYNKKKVNNSSSVDAAAADLIESTLSVDEKIRGIREYFTNNTSLDPQTTKITLGVAYDHVTSDTLLTAVEKMLRLYRSDATNESVEVDERDNLEFQKVYAVEDTISEVLTKEKVFVTKIRGHLDSLNVQKLRDIKSERNLAGSEKNATLRKIFTPTTLSKSLKNFLTSSSTSRLPSQINPLEIATSPLMVTRLGAGAITSERAVPDDSRAVNYSYMGVIDPVETPESSKIGIDTRFSLGAHKGDDNELYRRVVNTKTGKVELLKVIDLYDKYIGIPSTESDKGGVIGADMVKKGEIYALHKSEVVPIKKSKADYMLVGASDIYSVANNYVPFVNAIQANRVVMGGKHMQQALPLVGREKRLVAAATSKYEKNIHDLIGGMVIPKTKAGGVVSKITEDEIHIKSGGNTGTGKGSTVEVVPFVHNYPLASKTMLHNKLNVKVGDKVAAGQELGDSNFTKDGELALGTNLQVAYLPYFGYNHEDGIVISESASEKLKSEHVTKVNVGINKGDVLDKQKYASIFPTTFTKAQLSKLSANGVIRKGSTVEFGDPIVVIVSDDADNRANQVLGNLHKSLIRPYRDSSYTFDMHVPGEIIDISVGAKQIMVVIKYSKKAGVGDKLCYDKITEVLTKLDGWKLVKDVVVDESVATYVDGNLVYDDVSETHHYPHCEEMYRAESIEVDINVSANHSMLVRFFNEKSWSLSCAKNIIGKFVKYLTDADCSRAHAFCTELYANQTEELYTPTEPTPVYGITVPSGVVFVRRKGKTVWSGNSGSYGNKGVISRVVPDADMIQQTNGEVIDVAMTPAGVPGRINPAQILETALGKVAKKTGKPYAIENFGVGDYVKFAKNELIKNKVSETDDLIDPQTGKKIKNVFTGYQYVHKGMKTSDTGFAARGIDGPHDQDEAPTGSGEEGPKGIGGMEVNALVGHNARAILHESSALRSSKNTEFWSQYQNGMNPELPMVKKTFGKFQSVLKQAGVSLEKKGDKLLMGPLTDADISKLSKGEIKNAKRLDYNLNPESGGLFDPSITGGIKGEGWSHIKLEEPVVSPVFEGAAKTLLGLSTAEFNTLYKEEGGKAIKKRLNALNIDKELKSAEAATNDVKLSGGKLDTQVKRVKYLRALKDIGFKAGDAYVMSKIAVTPPTIRPITIGMSGDIMENDANTLYRDIILQNESFKKLKKVGISDEDLQENRVELSNRVKELTGTISPANPALKGKGVKGALNYISGDQPKDGYFHKKVVYSKMNLSGRGVIAPDHSIGMDEVGVPEDMAWGMYKPFVIRKLIQMGYGATQAREAVDQRSVLAKSILQGELEKRPVLLNRAPTLWRFGITAAKPVIRPGNTIGFNTLNEAGFNADFDGDAINLHTVVTDKAIEDAKKMMPSKLIFSDSKRGDLLQAPSKEAVTGLYMGTKNLPSSGIGGSSGAVKGKYKNIEEAWAAYYRGDIKVTDRVTIG